MASDTWNILSLCAGIGGLDLGLRAAGFSARTVCYVEREVYLAVVLAARMADGLLDRAPVWSDLRSFDGGAWRGAVDCVCAGFPCQPHSVAGRRGGTGDARWLWPEIWRIVGDVEPGWLFLENVPGLLTFGGFDPLLADLAEGGWAAEWGCFSAAGDGAPHRRERLFLLAHGQHAGPSPPRAAAGPSLRSGGPGLSGAELAHADRTRGRHAQPERGGRSAAKSGGHGETLADASGNAGYPLKGQRETIRDEPGVCFPRFPPGPADRAAWERVLAARPDLAPALSAQPRVRGVADGVFRGLDRAGTGLRTHRLRALGNAVVPATAARAFRVLSARLHDGDF